MMTPYYGKFKFIENNIFFYPTAKDPGYEFLYYFRGGMSWDVGVCVCVCVGGGGVKMVKTDENRVKFVDQTPTFRTLIRLSQCAVMKVFFGMTM